MSKQSMKKAFRWGLVSVLALQLMGCGQSPVRNPFSGRQEPKLGALPALSAPIAKNDTAQVVWSTSAIGKQQRFSKLTPAITGTTVYMADYTGKVVALDRNTGNKLWNNNTGEKFTAGPSQVNNLLLLATRDAKVVALDATTGHRVWESKVNSEVLAAPSGGNGFVLVHAMDGSVSALDARTGKQVWQVDESTPSLTLHCNSSPIVVGDTVLVGFASGKLLALNLQNGMMEWERTISLPRGRSELQRMVDISADPIVVGETVYAITYQGKLAAVNIKNGDLEWEREISSYQNMAADQKHLFVTDNAHILWAIDRHTGTTLWKQPALAERFITGPAVVNGMVAVGDRGGVMHFVAAENGHLLNRLAFSGKFYQGPIAMGQRLFINNNSGKVAAIAVNGSAA